MPFVLTIISTEADMHPSHADRDPLAANAIIINSNPI